MSKLLIIDANSIMNRAYYANPNFMTSKGQHTGAVFGFLNMYLKIKEEIQPDYVAAAFDRKAPTFRHKEYEEYKAGRKKMPEELAVQFPLIKEILPHFAVDILEIDGFEADDLIGTLSLQAEADGDEVYILSGDKDTLQLASGKTRVIITKKGVSVTAVYDHDAFVEEYGITPTQFIDIKGLMGDASDNIKGVPGIGEKTAFKLIKEYGSVENVLEHAEEIPQKRVRENLLEYREDAIFSKRLATIIRDVQVDIDLHALRSQEAYDVQAIRRIFSELEFKSLLGKIKADPEEGAGKDQTDPTADFTVVTVSQAKDLEGALEQLQSSLEKEAPLAMDFTVNPDPKLSNRDMVTLVLATAQRGVVLNMATLYEEGAALGALEALLTDGARKKVSFNVKDAYTVLRKHGIELQGVVFDANLAAYLLNPVEGKLTLKELVEKHLPMVPEVQGEKAAPFYASKLLALHPVLGEAIQAASLEELLYEVEMPLTYVLSRMETEGFTVDLAVLSAMEERFGKEIEGLEASIHDLAGESFNINSPKQLGAILFEKLDLPVQKKTKTGYSTNVEVLEALREKHPIIEKIMAYRTASKIYSTYLIGLKNAVDEDGRIHSTFNQTLTTTGRISSTEPNLQNIPIRHEMGREIRKAFIPHDEGSKLVAADYSQIELRVLAHIAGDENMIEAFNENIDIHQKTAAEVFNVPLEEVTYTQRSNAKAVNFGIVYGISDFALSGDLGISRKQAKEYIDIYFQRYPKVKDYLDQAVADAKEKGYVTTLLHRRRYIPEINERNKMVQAAGVRLAMNTPIQGSAADIIKMAMVRVFHALEDQGLASTLILQVHDELILNVPEAELDQVRALVVEEMERVIQLKVALVADESTGANWYEA